MAAHPTSPRSPSKECTQTNGGELISSRFFEICDKSATTRSFAPAYVHELNGMAERAIGVICTKIRALLLSSGANVKYWVYAATTAVDIHNSIPSSTRPDSTPLSRLNGEIPNLLSIMPFGCAAIATVNSANRKKSDMSPRGSAGIHLGRATDTPGAFYILLRDMGRISTTTDVVFNERVFPWKSDEPPTARPCVLLLFSGPHDGELVKMLRDRGIPVKCFDNENGWNEDILNDTAYNELTSLIDEGHFTAVHAAPPCTTCSIARFYPAEGKDRGPPPVRTYDHPDGLPSSELPPTHAKELAKHNEIIRRTCLLVARAHAAGAHISLENPADRSDPTSPLFTHRQHGSLWRTSWYQALQSEASLQKVTFAMCMLGSDYQKYTTIAYNAELHPSLGPLATQSCSHPPGTHKLRVGGREPDGTWASPRAAAYPTGLNIILDETLATPRRGSAPAANGTADVDMDPVSPEPTPPTPDGPRPDGDTFDMRNRGTNSNPPASDEPPAKSKHKPPQRFLIPREHWPDYPCDEHDGAGWEVTITQKRGPWSLCKFSTIQQDGQTWSKEWRKHKDLIPLDNSTDIQPAVSMASLAATAHAYQQDIETELQRAADRAACITPGDDAIAMTLVLRTTDECLPPPKTRAQAERDNPDSWKPAIQKELTACTRNKTWRVIRASDIPANRRCLYLLWVFKVKRDGTFKARLCVQGSRQVPGVDFDQSWAGTMRASSLRLLSALAARDQLLISRWDLTSAYLQGELEEGETIYTHPAPGEPTHDEHGNRLAWILDKPLYGLVQGGRRFQRCLFAWLLEQGFTRCKADPCLFVRDGNNPTDRIILGCYVDDIMVLHATDDVGSTFCNFRDQFFKRWEAEDEGHMTDLLNVQIQREPDGSIVLHQQPYIKTLIARFFPDGVPNHVQATSPPCTQDLAQLVADASLIPIPEHRSTADEAVFRRYASIVGSLLYAATHTRPDITYAIGMLTRVMCKPNPLLLAAAERVLLYLSHHSAIGLRYTPSQTQPQGWTDASWDVGPSTSGWLINWQQAAVFFASKKQPCIATSSAHAEIIALSEGAKECVHLQEFTDEVCPPTVRPMTLATDNKAARDLAYNPEYHDRTKHIARRHFYVREVVEDHAIRVPFVATHENLADFFTKYMPPKKFFALRKIIMNLH